jgi:hypothetical protein
MKRSAMAVSPLHHGGHRQTLPLNLNRLHQKILKPLESQSWLHILEHWMLYISYLRKLGMNSPLLNELLTMPRHDNKFKKKYTKHI